MTMKSATNIVGILRAEGLAVLVLTVVWYAHLRESWGMFALLFLVPDLAMLGYLGGPKTGAAVYNAFHTYVFPLLLGAVGLLMNHMTLLGVSLIWTAHIGVDRALGFGLKISDSFNETHLGSGGARKGPRSAPDRTADAP